MVAEYQHDGSKSGDGRGGGAGPLHQHEVITLEELRSTVAAKLCRSFAVTPLRCRERACSFTPVLKQRAMLAHIQVCPGQQG